MTNSVADASVKRAFNFQKSPLLLYVDTIYADSSSLE